MKQIIILFLLVNLNVRAQEETPINSIGANGKVYTFYRDRSYLNLGEAYKDPSGTIWGDIVKNSDGSIRNFDYFLAMMYCRSIDAELPSRDDFRKLALYMGTTISYRVDDYIPQVLPNLIYQENGSTRSYFFWSSTTELSSINNAFYFSGWGGFTDAIDKENNDLSARCIVRNH